MRLKVEKKFEKYSCKYKIGSFLFACKMILVLSTLKIMMMCIYFMIFFTYSDLLLNILLKSKNRFQKYFLLELLFKKNESVRIKGYADSKYFYGIKILIK